ncbi:hypothetical protein DRO61_10625, partial [Candidatus Bathyarchaeota archaeon]
MAITTVRVLAGYTQIGKEALAQESIIRNISFNDGTLPEGAVSAKVFVHSLSTIQDYVPGTGITASTDGSDYVTVSNLKDRAINELFDGLSVEAAYNSGDYVAKRYDAALKARAEDDDTIGFAKMVTDGTVSIGSFGTTVITITNFVVGNWYKIKVVNSAGDATTFGCAAATAVVGEEFKALTDGTGMTDLTAYAVDAPTASTVAGDILDLKAALDAAKAPRSGRWLVVDSIRENLLLTATAGIVLAEPASKMQQVEGSIGRLYGFNIFSTVLLPSGTNMIAGHNDAFYFKDIFRHEARIVSLDGSA